MRKTTTTAVGVHRVMGIGVYHMLITTMDNSADSDSSSEEEGAVASWCHCSLTPDGLLIKCDNCSGRGLDRRKGADGQHRKAENVSAGESSATESGDEEEQIQKEEKGTEKAHGTPKGKKVKAFREGSRKSMRMKNSTTEASVLDENTAEGWESRIRQWTDQYEEALINQYSADVQTLLELHRAASNTVSKLHASGDAMDTINRTELACNNTVLGSQMQLQLGRVTRVQKHRKMLRAAKHLEPDTLVIEYRGKVMLKQQFEVNGQFFRKPYPFVLFYSKFDGAEMCVDARTFGNDARFIRRSCTPNAEVRHMIADGMIHLCIYAVSHITKDAEVTIGFDYDFNSCQYKVDCGCHKAETRRRKARRREIESCVSGDSNQNLDQHQEAKDLQGASDTEERLQDELKAEEGEVDENGAAISNKRTCLSVERRRKRVGGAEVKEEGGESEDGAGNPAGNTPLPPNTGVGVSTRRTSYVMKKDLITHPASSPRPPLSLHDPTSLGPQKSDLSLPVQFPPSGASVDDEASQGPYGAEHVHGESALHLLDGDSLNCINRGNLRYPKTKKYLVTEWLNDKVPGAEKVHQDVPVERPLRITTDPTVLATTLNMLPGLSHSSLICTAPKTLRAGPRPLQMDGTYGCYKKEVDIKQVEDESCSASVEDCKAPVADPPRTPCPAMSTHRLKKRRSKFMAERTPAPSDHLLRPLSPISPPLPEDSLHSQLLKPLLESPVAVTSDDFSLPGGPSDSQGQSSTLPHNKNREQAFRTEFNLIYTCSPLNANLGNPVAPERHLSQSEGGFFPGRVLPQLYQRPGAAGRRRPRLHVPLRRVSLRGGLPGQWNASAHQQPTTKEEGKQRANQHTISLLTGKPDYQAIAVRSEYKPVQNMVSLLEYRKRKQGSGRDSEPAGSSSSLGGTPTRPGLHYSQDPPHPHHQHLQPSPHSSFSAPQMEELSPPDQQGSSGPPRHRDSNNQWMVPTDVERLREGQGVLERVLRSIKMERGYKRSEGSSEKESDADRYEVGAVSPMTSPHRNSPSVYSQQLADTPLPAESLRQTDSPSFLQQTSNFPFRGSYSPSSGQSFYPRLSSSHPPASQDHPPSSSPTSSSDCRLPALNQQSGSSSVDGGYGSGHLKASLLNSSCPAGIPGPRAHGQTKIDSGAQASRGGQQQLSHTLKAGSPGQAGQASSRLLSAPGPSHYPQRGQSLSQFQHSPLQGPGVRTQSGSF
ncbi:hypothetical protein KUCAC02_031230 [Chaenocephalus aceratus]|uniref:Uncharacterized protein n=1 Tax=Chaenocephalus aceratus TaxID=36190 RepID=A0ACB9XML7_CHAAC|nr:hypothetical protein KUCAC02_031230 [Chaenocephalus aceratus]